MADNNAKQETKVPSSSMQNMNYWDMFRKDVYGENNKQNTSSVADNLLRVVKLVAYIVLFLLVFGGSAVTRASLQILTDTYTKEKKTKRINNLAKDAISYYLLFLLIIPDGVKLMLSFFRVIFGKRNSPSIVRMIVIVIKECLHMFCLAVIVFIVMPKLNSVEVCAYTAGMPLVPSIMYSIFYGRKCTKRCCKQILNILAIILQAIGITAVPLYKLFKDQIDTGEAIWMIVASLLVSVRWCETYLQTSRESSIFRKLFDYKNHSETHCVSTLVSSFMRIVLMLILFPTFFAKDIVEPSKAFSPKPEMYIDCPLNVANATIQSTIRCTRYADESIMNPFLVHFFTCMALYYSAVLATKLCMDRICFGIALAVSTPVYVIAILISSVNHNWISNKFIPEANFSDVYIMAGLFLVAWLGQLWICRHIWYSSHNRIMFENKLFVLPHYCSPLADISLLHSRHVQSSEAESTKYEEQICTKVYICATMWHENRTEMKQIMKTLFRLDYDQAVRQIAKDEVKDLKDGSDYYEFEAHILFDDAMQTVDGKREPNEFVKQMMEIITEAGTAVYDFPTNMNEPDKLVTPYGGRLIYKLPGHNNLIVHLKDKDKIRHKKRWSQIMYMYYLLGFKLLQKEITNPIEKNIEKVASIYEALPMKVLKRAENTYVMALDGDVDFSPEALLLLIDRMKKNPKVGAACGRIKPGGSGPVVWYQTFEYAIGHWLQKSAEHVFGCVLCSPGCFSLFRAKALMDDNVMRTYASMPTKPEHYLQYDQGEDRWLCTLMLQQGHKIEYCAAAEALTFAPEDFREFFNQRRRWLPSTMANILDLLISHRRTTRHNSNISSLYIIYQWILFLSSILGPSLVLLAMKSAVTTIIKDGISNWLQYVIIYLPTVIFIYICLKCKTQTQLTIAMVLSAAYAMAMMAVLVGTIVNIAEEGFFAPTAVFMYVIIGIFLIAGLFHPHELGDLFWGVLYFVCIPAGYLFLIVYAICNLNNVSWGTRETQKAVLEQQPESKKLRKKQTEEEFGIISEDVLEDILKQIKTTKVKDTSYTDMIPNTFQWYNNLALLRSLESAQNIFRNIDEEKDEGQGNTSTLVRTRKKRLSFAKSVVLKSKSEDSDGIDDETWANDNGSIKRLKEDEVQFWTELIEHYLKPIDANKEKEKEVAQSLKEFRNKVTFAFFFINALWAVIMSAMNEVKGVLNIQIPTPGGNTTIEPLGLLFLLIFAILLVLQFFGMIRHRYGTLLHVLSVTNMFPRRGDPETIIQKIKGKGTDDIQEFVIDKNSRQRMGGNNMSNTSGPDKEDVDPIYENFMNGGRKIELGKSMKRRPVYQKNAPFDLKKTLHKKINEQHVGRRHKKITEVL